MSPSQNPAQESQLHLFSNHSNSKFEQFIKQTIKVDLFNLTYDDEIFSQLLKDFIPRSDAFIKPGATPAVAQSRVERSQPRPEHLLSVGGDRKFRKSKKLELTTQLIDVLIKAISSYS